jgi:TonB family protein
MKSKLLALCFALSLSLTIGAAAPIPSVFTSYANAEIVIEANGEVSAIQFVGPKLGDGLEASLSSKIKAPNLFQAGQLNGKPARTRSLITLQLRAQSDVAKKQTVFSLYNVMVSTMAMPNPKNRLNYPESMLRTRREAKLTVAVTYNARGDVTDAQIDPAPNVHEQFRKSALRYASNMKFFVEEVGGIKQGGQARIPIVYKIAGRDDATGPYTLRLPAGGHLDMQPGEPAPELISVKMNAALTKPFVPQSLLDG